MVIGCTIIEMELAYLLLGIILGVSLCPGSVLSSDLVEASPLARQCTWLYRGNSKDCRSYFQCFNGRSVLRRCPRGLFWNAEGSYCDWKLRSKCKSGNAGNSSSIAKWQVGTCEPNTYRPHPGDCNKYILCGTMGHENIMECTPGLHWDAQYLVCNWPQFANCQSGGGESPQLQPSPEAPAELPTPPPPPPPPPSFPSASTIAPFFPVAAEGPPKPSTVPSAQKPIIPAGIGDHTQYPILLPASG